MLRGAKKSQTSSLLHIYICVGGGTVEWNPLARLLSLLKVRLTNQKQAKLTITKFRKHRQTKNKQITHYPAVKPSYLKSFRFKKVTFVWNIFFHIFFNCIVANV